MNARMLIRGMLPVCRRCREVNGEEPDKCGRLEWCKSLYAAGEKWGAEDCTRACQTRLDYIKGTKPPSTLIPGLREAIRLMRPRGAE